MIYLNFINFLNYYQILNGNYQNNLFNFFPSISCPNMDKYNLSTGLKWMASERQKEGKSEWNNSLEFGAQIFILSE